MLIDGIAASEALDTSGEVFEVKGADITSFNDGTAHFNYEHKGHDDVKIQGSEIVGKILSGKKIYKKSDCSNEREEMYWDFCKVPFIYIVGRLYDSAGHQGAGEIAAIIRDAHANDDKVSIGFSIEGSTLERKENRLVTTVCRRVAITLKSCNKTAHLGLLQDPNAPAGFDKEPSKVDIASMVDKAELNGMYQRM
jgi:hypothetical protein